MKREKKRTKKERVAARGVAVIRTGDQRLRQPIDYIATAEEAARLLGGSAGDFADLFPQPEYPYMRPLQPLAQAMDPGPPQVEPTVYEMMREVLKEKSPTLKTGQTRLMG